MRHPIQFPISTFDFLYFVVPNAHHYVFLSNRPDVLRELNAFLATL